MKAQVLVVRVYQFRSSTGAVAGVLEVAASGEQKAFCSFRELRQVMLASLNNASSRSRPDIGIEGGGSPLSAAVRKNKGC